MKKLTTGLLVSLVICFFSLPVDAAKKKKSLKLVSTKVNSAPKVDGNAGDPQWESAEELIIDFEDGPEKALVKTVYTDKEIFFLFQWEDASGAESIKPDMWVYDGKKWNVMQEVKFDGEDPSAPDNDMLSLQWVIKNSIPGFDEKGCLKLCHSPEKEDKMYTNNPGELSDLWLWKSGISNPVGYTDDYHLDHTNILVKDEPDKIKRINAAHKGDDLGPGGLNYVRNEENGQPKWMPKGGSNKNPFLIKGNEAPFDKNKKYKKGDTLPGWLLARPKGSRGDINAAGKFNTEDGVWTVEMSRTLVTSDKKYDVQFDHLKKTYYFGMANWDNDVLNEHTRVKKVIGLSFK